MKKTTTTTTMIENRVFNTLSRKKIFLIAFLLLASAISAYSQPASALNFDGTDDYVALPDITPAFTNGQVSGEAWVYLNYATSWASIMKNWTGNIQGMFHLGLDVDPYILSIYITQSNGTAVSVSKYFALPESSWHHVAFSADGSFLHLYVDGIEVNTPAAYDGTLYTGVTATFLGAKPGDSQISPDPSLPGFWQGSMDEVRIWNRGLTQTEIQQHMNCELSGTQTGLIAYYKFNQGTTGADNSSELMANDASGNNNTASLTNFLLYGTSSNWTSGTINSVCGSEEYTYYYDGDGDGYGKPYFPLTTTEPVPPANYVILSGDCNDSNAGIHPGVAEVCNTIDDNCDGTSDEACGTSYTYYFDGDGDGYGRPEFPIVTAMPFPPYPYTVKSGDCNDENGSVFPSATEYCNAIDDNCSGDIDEACTIAYTYYFDADGDGYGQSDFPLVTSDSIAPYSFVTLNGDCNDGNAVIFPLATEYCNGIDDNCSGDIDEACTNIPIPDFTNTDINGVSHHLYDDLLAGNAVILEFSTGWCVPSQITEPMMSEVYDDICQGQGNIKLYDLVFETDNPGMLSDDAFGNIYADRHNITYPVLTGTGDVYYSYGGLFQNYNIPWFLVIIPDTITPQYSSVYQIIGAEPLLKDSIEHILTTNGFIITPPPALSISVSGDVCEFSEPVILSSNQTTGNLWSTGDTTQTIEITTGGDYYLSHAADCGTIIKKMYIGNGAVVGTLSLLSGSKTCSGMNSLLNIEYDGDPAIIQFSNDSMIWDDYIYDFSGVQFFTDEFTTGSTVYLRAKHQIYSNAISGNCDIYSNVVQFTVLELTETPEITIIDSTCSFPVTLQSFSAVNNFWLTGDTTQSISVSEEGDYYVISTISCGMVYAYKHVSQPEIKIWFSDTDEDGYGDINNSLMQCAMPEGYVNNSEDCDDANEGVYPAAIEICNGIDDNCNSMIDEGDMVPPTGSVAGYLKVCRGEANVIYTANDIVNATSYQWVLPAGMTPVSGGLTTATNTINVNIDNTFNKGKIKVRGLNSCSAGSYSPPLMITRNTGKPSTPSAINSLSGASYGYCGDGVYVFSVLSAPDADNYNWSASAGTILNGQGTNTVSIKLNGIYGSCRITVSAENCAGMSRSRSLVVKPSLHAPGVSGPANICLAESTLQSYTITSSENAVSYTWSSPSAGIMFSDGGAASNPLTTINSNVNVSYAALPAGICNIKTTFSNGCRLSPPAVKTITVSACTRMMDNDMNENEDLFSVYPNPATDIVTISFEVGPASAQIIIANELGEIIHSASIYNETQYMFNCSEFAEGIYFVRMQTDTYYTSKKLIITK